MLFGRILMVLNGIIILDHPLYNINIDEYDRKCLLSAYSQMCKFEKSYSSLNVFNVNPL
jgi:hypothetical protein